MKKVLLTISIFVSFIFLYIIPNTNAEFTDSKSIDNNNFETAILLNFYLRDDKHAVGFRIDGVNNFDQIEYRISYNHGIDEEVNGLINLSNENSYKEEWIILGSCSAGLVCNYYDVVGEINLVVNLIKAGLIEKTLTKTLTLK